MRAVVQRVRQACVSVEGDVVGEIGRGLLVLLGVGDGDSAESGARLARKIAALRIFEDDAGKMNLALHDAGGEVLCVSQFTLYGDVRRGNRPSFTQAAAPAEAQALYESFCAEVESVGLRCARGVFGAHMDVELLNDGPVTLIIDTHDLEQPRRP